MKKILKILILLSSFIFIYFIYNLNNNNNITYISMGDSLALGENSYGAIGYSYSDFFKDYLNSNNKLMLYSKDFSNKTNSIKDVYNDILKNKEIKINNSTYGIKELLRESDVVTLSIGLNDLIYEYNISNKIITSYEEDRIVDKVFNNYQDLISEIKKYYVKKIYVVGYYTNDKYYDSLILKFNKKVENYISSNNDIYIDTTFLDKKNFDNVNSYYPNYYGYKKISEKLISRYK